MGVESLVENPDEIIQPKEVGNRIWGIANYGESKIPAGGKFGVQPYYLDAVGTRTDLTAIESSDATSKAGFILSIKTWAEEVPLTTLEPEVVNHPTLNSDGVIKGGARYAAAKLPDGGKFGMDVYHLDDKGGRTDLTPIESIKLPADKVGKGWVFSVRLSSKELV